MIRLCAVGALAIGLTSCAVESVLQLDLLASSTTLTYRIIDDPTCAAPFGGGPPGEAAKVLREETLDRKFSAGQSIGWPIDPALQKRRVRVEVYLESETRQPLHWCACPELPRAGATMHLPVAPSVGVPTSCDRVSLADLRSPLATGESCTAGWQCESEHCRCDDASCSERVCDDSKACVVCQYGDDCTALDGVRDPSGCLGDATCVEGQCRTAVGSRCGASAFCGKGNKCLCDTVDCREPKCFDVDECECNVVTEGVCTEQDVADQTSVPDCGGECLGGDCVIREEEHCGDGGQCAAGLSCVCVGEDCSEQLCLQRALRCGRCEYLDANRQCVASGAGKRGEACGDDEISGFVCTFAGDCLPANGAACDPAAPTCYSGLCECADPTCQTSKCSALDCSDCTFNADGNLDCEGRQEDGTDSLSACGDGSACFEGSCAKDIGADCTQHSDCGSGHCECADASCENRVCSEVACNCHYNANGDDACGGPVAVSFVYPDGRCADFGCDGRGACRVGLGYPCGTGVLDGVCGQGGCECTNADCTESLCHDGECGVCSVAVSATECVGLQAFEGSSDCGGDGEVCDGSGGCGLDDDVRCVVDDDCVSGSCVCQTESCTLRYCRPKACDCQFMGDTDVECAGAVRKNVADEVCGTVACDGLGSCQAATGQPCSVDAQCVSGACWDGQVCCATQCEGACERCDTTDGVCTDDAELCVGNCDNCVQGVCVAETNSSCAGDCSVCSETGANDWSCAKEDALCPSSGETLCTECLVDASDTKSFSCTYQQGLGAAECLAGGYAATGYECVAAGMCAGQPGAECVVDGDCAGSSTCRLPSAGPGTCCDPTGPCVWGVAASDSSSCAARGSLGVACWGKNDEDVLGITGITSSLVPVHVTGLPVGPAAVDVDVGPLHACVALGEGSVWCWGRRDFGRLGIAGGSGASAPVAVDGLGFAVKVSVGKAHSCALTSDGVAWCWGARECGQLGGGISGDCSSSGTEYTPDPVSMTLTGSIARDVAAGDAHTCVAHGASRYTECWGANSQGQLGDGYRIDSAEANSVGAGQAVWFDRVSAGASHTCGIATDGSVWCWGDNSLGAIGDNNSPTDALMPTRVCADDTCGQFLTGALSISAGAFATCAVVGPDGQTWCWGSNLQRQGGTSGASVLRHATLVDSSVGRVAVSIGGTHTCGVSSTGAVQCWGSHDSGRTGVSEATGTTSVPGTVTAWP